MTILHLIGLWYVPQREYSWRGRWRCLFAASPLCPPAIFKLCLSFNERLQETHTYLLRTISSCQPCSFWEIFLPVSLLFRCFGAGCLLALSRWHPWTKWHSAIPARSFIDLISQPHPDLISPLLKNLDFFAVLVTFIEAPVENSLSITSQAALLLAFHLSGHLSHV